MVKLIFKKIALSFLVWFTSNGDRKIRNLTYPCRPWCFHTWQRPDARGIFLSNDKSFAVYINEVWDFPFSWILFFWWSFSGVYHGGPPYFYHYLGVEYILSKHQTSKSKFCSGAFLQWGFLNLANLDLKIWNSRFPDIHRTFGYELPSLKLI